MRFKHIVLSIAIACAGFANAQTADSSSAKNKTVTHDLGFNTVLLVKQIISNSPTNFNSMLPYQVVYTAHFKEKAGLRVGLGLFQSKNETSISGQTQPRTTNFFNTAARLGFNYNFLKHKGLTCNAFLDGVYQNSSSKTVNTTTFTSGPMGQTSIDVFTTENKSTAIGGQVGFGIKYNVAKHIALYTELPLQFTALTGSESVNETLNGVPQVRNNSITNTKGTNTQIFLPTTLFLLITF